MFWVNLSSSSWASFNSFAAKIAVSFPSSSDSLSFFSKFSFSLFAISSSFVFSLNSAFCKLNDSSNLVCNSPIFASFSSSCTRFTSSIVCNLFFNSLFSSVIALIVSKFVAFCFSSSASFVTTSESWLANSVFCNSKSAVNWAALSVVAVARFLLYSSNNALLLVSNSFCLFTNSSCKTLFFCSAAFKFSFIFIFVLVISSIIFFCSSFRTVSSSFFRSNSLFLVVYSSSFC